MTPRSTDSSPASTALRGKQNIAEEAVRTELELVLASQRFRDSPVLKRFLRYIVEHTLAGEGQDLKEYRLGVDVFERAPSFDPRLDPAVRLAARRLRAKLQEHYENEGRNDPVRIEVPKGGYAPCFMVPTKAEAGRIGSVVKSAEQQLERSLASSKRERMLAAGLVTIAAMMAAALYFYFHFQHAKRLTEKDTIVIADFANSTGDPVFDDTLKTALGVSLRQSPFLNLLSEQKTAETLRMMTRPADARLTLEIVRDVCQRTGSKAYIGGAIGILGDEYVLGLKAVNCQNGDTLAQEQTTAATKAKVLAALDQAAAKMRTELGESLATVQKFDVPLEEATTPSLEALKVFSLGQKVYREKGPDGSKSYNQQAVQIDPNFALGNYELGADYYSLGEIGRASEYFTKAFQLRGQVSEREKLAIAAHYYRNVTGEIDKAIQTDEEEIESYPREMLAYIRLGIDFASEGEYEKAKEATEKAHQLAPDHLVPYDNLSAYALALQRFDEAERIIEEAHARKLDNVLLHNDLYALAFFNSDAARMAEQLRWYSGTPQETYGLALASDTEAYIGHLRKARQLTQQALDSALHADSKEIGAIWLENAALREAAYGFPSQARTMAATGLKLAPTSQGVEAEAALAFSMAGDRSRAESLAQDLNKRFPLDTQMQSLWLPPTEEQLALNKKNPASSLGNLQATSTVELGLIPYANNVSCLYPIYERGQALLAEEQGEAAAAEFQKILDHNGMVWNCWTGALARLGAARANALRARGSRGADAEGVRGRAVAAYKTFLTLWKDADPGIPILKQAEIEYAKLQ